MANTSKNARTNASSKKTQSATNTRRSAGGKKTTFKTKAEQIRSFLMKGKSYTEIIQALGKLGTKVYYSEIQSAEKRLAD